jgi:hypothetical protein
MTTVQRRRQGNTRSFTTYVRPTPFYVNGLKLFQIVTNETSPCFSLHVQITFLRKHKDLREFTSHSVKINSSVLR